MADDKAQTITGSCSIGGEDVGLTGVKATMAVNAWPLFNIEAALYATSDASSKVVKVSELRDKLKEWQGRINSGGLPASFSVDGAGSLSLKDGHVASVGIDVSVGHCRVTAVVLPSYAAVDALNLGLYLPCVSNTDVDTALLTLYAEARKACGGNITLTRYTKELVKLVVSKYKNQPYKEKGGETAAAVADAVHGVNMEVLDTFYELLGNSEGVDDVYGLNALISSNGISNIEPIGAAIVSSLMRPTGSFLSSICAYANLFRLFYKPGLDNIGSLASKSSMYMDGEGGSASGGGSLSSAVLAISGNAHSTSQFPLGTVYSVTDASGLDVDTASQAKNVVSGFTGQEGGGPMRTMQIAPPVWLSAYMLPPVTTNGEGGGAQTQTSQPSEMAGEDDKETKKKNREVISGLLKKWCEMEYYDQKWGNYTVALTVPGVAVGCGGRMGTEMGSGFLRVSQCVLSLGSGGRGYCRTMLTFSHFKYGA